MPVISIVMPAHNAEKTIRNAVEDILAQTFRDFELVVVDDGSIDNTAHIVREYTVRDRRVLLVQQEQGGAAVARNLGIERAVGKYIVFLDADDAFSPEFLGSMVCAMDSEDADVCVCEANAFDLRTGTRYPLVRLPDGAGSCMSREEFGSAIFKTCYTAPWNKLIKVEMIRNYELRFQDIAAHNDIFFICAVLAYANKIAIVRKPLVQYYVGCGSSIQDKRVCHPYCEFEALERLGRESCIADTKDDVGLQAGFRTLVVDSFFNSAPAVIAGKGSFQHAYERFRRLLEESCDTRSVRTHMATQTRAKEWILCHFSERALENAFTAFSDQRRHSLKNKIGFFTRLVISSFGGRQRDRAE